ncbi:MAG TPA: hypothetical protein VGQ20_00130 [Acidimicrobiales bacterium]|jgi:hypothetical protein|nr:hypothetical protein [Acidimicrobiales bacterium]
MANQAPDDKVTVPGTDAAAAPIVERDLACWKEYLREQERLCHAHHFVAALVTVGVDAASQLDPSIEILVPMLRSTDRMGVLCPTELSVLLMPLESIHHAQRLVHVLDGALRTAGLPAHLGWAMRQEGHGLFHAAARADAAMLTAKGHGKVSVDLSDR